MTHKYTHLPRPWGVDTRYSEFTGKLWPNGEFVLAQKVPLSNKKVKAREAAKDDQLESKARDLTSSRLKEDAIADFRGLTPDEKIQKLGLILKGKKLDNQLNNQPTNHPPASGLPGGGTNITSNDVDNCTELLSEVQGDDLVLSSIGISHREKNSLGESPLPTHDDLEQGSVKNSVVGGVGTFRKGSTGITSYSRRMTRNGCDWLTKEYGKNRLGFLTFTLPQLDDVYMVALATNWSEIIRKFLQEYKRQLKRLNAPSDYVAVTEIQDNRYRSYGYVCPHLHIVCVADKTGKGDFYIDRHWFQDTWDRVLRNQLNYLKKRGLLIKKDLDIEVTAVAEDAESLPEFKARIDCQKVRKNASAYLSKYMSKRGALIDEIAVKSPELLPTSWLYMSASLRKDIKNSIRSFHQTAIARIFHNCDDLMFKNKIFYLPPGKREFGRGRNGEQICNYDFYQGEFEIPRKFGDNRPPLKLWWAVGKLSQRGLNWLNKIQSEALKDLREYA